MQNKKSSNRILASLLLVLLIIGGVFTFWQIRKSQELRNHAQSVTWYTAQSVNTVCNTNGTISITVSFTNAEATRSMIVSAKDTQSGKSINLGTIDPGKTKTGQIDTGMSVANAGTIEFKLAW